MMSHLRIIKTVLVACVALFAALIMWLIMVQTLRLYSMY